MRFSWVNYLAAVFFDIEKAYDTAWRRGILNTLKEWGIEGNMLAFVQNFLTNRSFFVRVGTAMSSRCVLENGVPQGSVLSVTLFAVAINNIVQCVHTPVSCSLYVDDFAIYVASRSLATAERLLQNTIGRLEAWSKRSGFGFSPTKTKCILFSRRRENPIPIF